MNVVNIVLMGMRRNFFGMRGGSNGPDNHKMSEAEIEKIRARIDNMKANHHNDMVYHTIRGNLNHILTAIK